MGTCLTPCPSRACLFWGREWARPAATPAAGWGRAPPGHLLTHVGAQGLAWGLGATRPPCWSDSGFSRSRSWGNWRGSGSILPLPLPRCPHRHTPGPALRGAGVCRNPRGSKGLTKAARGPFCLSPAQRPPQGAAGSPPPAPVCKPRSHWEGATSQREEKARGARNSTHPSTAHLPADRAHLATSRRPRTATAAGRGSGGSPHPLGPWVPVHTRVHTHQLPGPTRAHRCQARLGPFLNA